MMKTKKWLLLLVTVSLLLSGCNYEAIVDDVMHDLAHQLTEPEDVVEPFIGFAATEAEKTDELLQLKPEELQNYTSEYSSYNTYHYFQNLNDSEKLVYHAYEYALDHGYPQIWFDERLTDSLEWTGFDILQFLALDSALVEQNISQNSSGYTVTHSVLNIQTAMESYTCVYMDHFTQERMERKQDAVSQARQIIDGLPGDWTDREKSEYFFDYLGENVAYETDIPGEEYLYTALCQGRTNCDGYANAFALLCRLSDIPCIEINSDTPDDEEGHTWNAVYLEDKWVHVDATGAVDDVTSECENCREERTYFGFPDALLDEWIEYADLVPVCPEGLTPILQIPSGKIENFTDKVKEAFKENDRKLVVILVDEGDLEDQVTGELATELDCDLHYIYYETAEGKMVYYLFNDD